MDVNPVSDTVPHGPENALDGDERTFIKTRKGGWWSAQFDANKIAQVRIQNRRGCQECYEKLSGAEVYVEPGEQYCGKLPEKVSKTADDWWTITCETPLLGSAVVIGHLIDEDLHFA
jgi:hypothetical protein